MTASTIPTAADIMNRTVHTLAPTQPIVDAVQTLLARGFSGAPVVDASGQVVGVLSEKDYMRVLAASAFHGVPDGAVADHMSPNPVSVAPGDDLFQLADHFTNHDYRRLVVVDAGRHLLGLVTRRDVLRALDTLRKQRERAGAPSTYDMIARQHAKDQSE